MPEAEIDELWEPWTPYELAKRMSGVRAPWYIAAGWALELFTEEAARDHDDLEIGVPAARFGEVEAAFPGFEWDVAGDGIPYAAPEVALLFKAKHLRDKDVCDFRRVAPAMDGHRRARLAGWLAVVHPGHPWIASLDR